MIGDQKMYENLNESKLLSNISVGSKFKDTSFSKNANKGNAPKPADIQNMIKSINKKEGK